MPERGSAIAFAMMLMLAAPQPAAAATVTISAELQGGAIDIDASAMLNADAATAWRVLASSYALAPLASGARRNYAGQSVPGFELVGRIQQMAVERNAARQFRALADEIEHRHTAILEHAVAVPH